MSDEELARLKDHAAKYEWLLRYHDAAVAAAAWSVREACAFGDPDEAMSEAIKHVPPTREPKR